MKLKKLAVTALSIFAAMATSAQSKELLFSYDFENSMDQWSKRSGENIELTKEAAFSGEQCLKTSNRTASWNGPVIMHNALNTGDTYYIECYIMYHSETYMSHNYELCVSCNIDGNTEYATIDQTLCRSGMWHKLFGTIEFPANATDVTLYMQSQYTEENRAQDMMPFYIDDVKCYKLTYNEIDADSLDNLTPLKEYFAPYFMIGTSMSSKEIADENAQKHVIKHYNSITCENETKPEFLLDYEKTKETGKVCVTINEKTKAIMKFCEENEIAFRGHTLVWHSQTPEWFFMKDFNDKGSTQDILSKKEMSIRLEQYVQAVFEAISATCPYLNVYAFDVANEAYENDGGSIRISSPWRSIYKDESFMDSAFTYARKYAPKNCKLYYNDYNEYVEPKTSNIYNLAKRLYENGLCDGIGMQSHLSTQSPTIDTYEKALAKFSSIGDDFDLQITELDMTLYGNDTFKQQAEMYGKLFDLLVKYSEHISSVTFWGTTDGISWRKEGKPLVFFSSYTPKLAYYSIVHQTAPKCLLAENAHFDETRPDPVPNTIGTDIRYHAQQSELNVFGKAGGIVMASLNGTKAKASIYQTDGRLVGNYTVDGLIEIILPRGIYIVNNQKIAVM